MPEDQSTQNNQPVVMPAGEPPAEEHHPLPPAPPAPPKKRGKMWLVLPLLLVIVAAAAAYALVFKKDKPAQPAQLQKVSVRLEWVNNPEFAGMYIAQDMGYYKAAGLSVELKEFQDSTDVNKEVADNVVDYGVSTPLEVILARGKGQDNKAIAAIYQTSPYAIAAQKKANINSPSDFKGKILGDSGGNNEALITYKALLGLAGIPESQSTIKSVDFDILKVFNENQADTYDVYRTDQNYVLDQQHIPYTLVYPEQYGFAIYGDVLIASDSKIAKDPSQVKAFTSATLKGWQYAIDHPVQALSIIGRYMNEQYKDPAYQKFDLDNTLPLIKPTGGQPIGNMQYVPWNRAYNGVKEAGLLTASFDVGQVYTSQFVR
jgi:ABC-type nitrate/sulfonate/bicarbonate transport system substrate-binding protein